MQLMLLCAVGPAPKAGAARIGQLRRSQRRAIHREERGYGGHSGGDRPIERHHQRELSVGQSDGAEGVVEAPCQCSRGSLHMQAEAAVSDLDCGLVGDLRVAGVCAS